MYCPYALEGKAIAFLWPIEILVALQNTRTPNVRMWVDNWKSDMKTDLL